MKFALISLSLGAASAQIKSGFAGDLAIKEDGVTKFDCTLYEECIVEVGIGSCCVESDSSNANNAGHCTVVEGSDA